MILTGNAIKQEHANGKITIEPFDERLVNPNSYNFRLGNKLVVYKEQVLDPATENHGREILIPPDGYILAPRQLYLASTVEVLGSNHYVPTYNARSSVARLGLFINLSATLLDIGFKGQLTLQLYAANPVKVYAGMQIGQIMFWKPMGAIDLYSGKYQGSRGPSPTKIHKDFERTRV